jgi:hypothetical protein
MTKSAYVSSNKLFVPLSIKKPIFLEPVSLLAPLHPSDHIAGKGSMPYLLVKPFKYQGIIDAMPKPPYASSLVPSEINKTTLAGPVSLLAPLHPSDHIAGKGSLPFPTYQT